MGSFNTTCFVTNQTIAPGDRAILIPIHQETSYEKIDLSYKGEKFQQASFCSSTCYSTRFWGYAGPIITAEYDDYGRFIIDENESNIQHMRTLLNSLRQSAAKTEEGDNEYHDLAFDMMSWYDPKKEYSFEELDEIFAKVWEATMEQRVFVRQYNGLFTPFSFAVMHQASADYMIAEMENSKGWRDEPNDRFNFVKRRYSEAEEDLLVDFIASTEKGIGSFLLERIFTLSEISGGESGRFHQYYHIDFDTIMNKVKEAYLVTGKPLSDETINAVLPILKPMLDMYYISWALNSMNISVTPLVYAGQDYDNECGRAYAKMIAAVSKEVTKGRKDHYGEDWDEDDTEEEED